MDDYIVFDFEEIEYLLKKYPQVILIIMKTILTIEDKYPENILYSEKQSFLNIIIIFLIK
jgi:hypothetical protein